MSLLQVVAARSFVCLQLLSSSSLPGASLAAIAAGHVALDGTHELFAPRVLTDDD
jgi:hypothetical protein